VRRAAFAAFALLATLGLLAQTATPVAACSCIAPTAEVAVEQAHVILIGEPVALSKTPSFLVQRHDAQYEYGLLNRATIRAERYLKGSGPETIEVLGDICSGILGIDSLGLSHLLVLRYDPWLLGYDESLLRNEELQHRLPVADGCLGSGVIGHGYVSPFSLAELEEITGHGEPPNNSLAEPLPHAKEGLRDVAAVTAAIIIPVAFLFAAACAWPRRRGAP
jgi:hypothetical protein